MSSSTSNTIGAPLAASAFSSFTKPLRMAERLREHLLQEIKERRWTESLPSERQLSAQLRVSRPTLRAALHSLAAEGILEPKRGHPYRILQGSIGSPGSRHRSPEMVFLYTTRTRTRANLSIIAPFVAELQHRLHPHGFGVHMLNATQAGPKGFAKVLSRIDNEFYAAYYLLASVPPYVHEWFERQKINCIIVGSRDPKIKIPSIEVDQDSTLRHAVGYLARRNHRRISLLQRPIASVGDALAVEAFQRVCMQFKAHGVRGAIHTTPARPAMVEASVRRMLAGPQRPTAVVISDLELALGFYTTVGLMGINIPRDVSVVVTAHSPSFDFVRPFPSCYEFAWEALADRITKIVEHHCRLGTWPNNSWTIIPTFREGASVAPL